MIKWEPYAKGDVLCARFPLDEWHQLAGDVHSDKDWEDLVLNYSEFIKCWVLRRNSDNQSIAMIYILNEDDCWQKVSIHGGGWNNPLLYYRGYVLMLDYLLNKGIKVSTNCHLSNHSAIRFSRSVGFVPYRYTETEIFMWISAKRLKSSKFYKRFDR
jgi:hypothetical protein